MTDEGGQRGSFRRSVEFLFDKHTYIMVLDLIALLSI